MIRGGLGRLWRRRILRRRGRGCGGGREACWSSLCFVSGCKRLCRSLWREIERDSGKVLSMDGMG